MALIKVGAATETELKEKKARVEDAMHATKAAVEEGIVPGGGVALLRCQKALEAIKTDGDMQIGVNSSPLLNSCQATEENASRIRGAVGVSVVLPSGNRGRSRTPIFLIGILRSRSKREPTAIAMK